MSYSNTLVLSSFACLRFYLILLQKLWNTWCFHRMMIKISLFHSHSISLHMHNEWNKYNCCLLKSLSWYYMKYFKSQVDFNSLKLNEIATTKWKQITQRNSAKYHLHSIAFDFFNSIIHFHSVYWSSFPQYKRYLNCYMFVVKKWETYKL